MSFSDFPPSKVASGLPSSAEDEVLSVSALNHRVARLLEAGIPRVWVAGEVSNFTRAASGHWYFSIKDESAAVRAVMFRGRTQSVGFVPRVGDRCEFRVQVSLYEPRGDYQVQVETLRRAGRGDLHEAFLRLRDRLVQEGLIAPEKRRPIPEMPRVVGVVTSLAAAALRDVLSVLKRRAPHVRVIVYPAPVQGQEAAAQLCTALTTASLRSEVDVLLLVRGGGSIEDLWCFNDENLARTVAASPIPVISGVGHETDFTIADFVADLRAPTPTAAAELCCVSRLQAWGRVSVLTEQLARGQRRRLEQAAMRLDRATSQLVSPARQVLQWRQRLSRAVDALRVVAQYPLEVRSQRLRAARGMLQALDPRGVLQRGYAIVHRRDGTVAQNALDLKTDEPLDIELARGFAVARVIRSGDTL
ncbi:MAG TPA: exodeoxyribonuclease VII large subunit [Castellaniella sp.]|uniref:exodeoxyribonuclease VII large subunit n=1 Tax=Castellaniella sp. TaxID=1955812 RepID=UPI002F1D780B